MFSKNIYNAITEAVQYQKSASFFFILHVSLISPIFHCGHYVQTITDKHCAFYFLIFAVLSVFICSIVCFISLSISCPFSIHVNK